MTTAAELIRQAMREAQTRGNLELGSSLLQTECDNFNNVPGTLVGYDCPECNNRGRIAVIDGDYVMHKECKCMVVRRSLNRIERSGLKNQLDKCTFANYKVTADWQKSIKDKAQRFLSDSYGKWFYMGGQVGSGKTMICTAIVGELLKMGYDAKYMLWLDDVTPLKAGIMEDNHAFEMGKYKRVKVLYIDDFFKSEAGRTPSQADIKIAFEILNHRYNNPSLVTIISSEKTIKELLDIDEAIGSRIYERTKEYSINLNKDKNKNYRLRSE